jgi:hypothetical protein
MAHPDIPELADLKWIAVDFDGTLAVKTWSPDNPTHVTGQPIRANLDKLREVNDAGYNVVIHTARPWSDYQAIESWLDFYNVKYKGIVCGKLLAAAYIDDRGINASAPSWIPKGER